LTSFKIPSELKEKIFEIKTNSNNSVLKIISYFPLTELEQKNLISIINQLNALILVLFLAILLLMMNGIEPNLKLKSDFKMRFSILMINP